MSHFDTVFFIQTILSTLGVIASILLLRYFSLFQNPHSLKLFSNLTMKYFIPILVFVTLSRTNITTNHMLLALTMFLVFLTILLLSYFFATLFLNLSLKEMGSFLLVTSIGSSTTLGYALIRQAWPHQYSLLANAIFISEFGAVLPLFTVGIAVAAYCGGGYSNKTSIYGALKLGIKTVLKSPVFIALCLGIVFSLLKLNRWLPHFLENTLNIIATSSAIFVFITIALMLKRVTIKKMFFVILICILIKLVISPLCATFYYHLLLGSSKDNLLVVLIEATMPSGAMAAIVSLEQGCDDKISSTLICATYIASIFILPTMLYFLA